MYRATCRLLYFAHILSPGDHVGPGSDASLACEEDQGCTVSWPLWYVRGTQGGIIVTT